MKRRFSCEVTYAEQTSSSGNHVWNFKPADWEFVRNTPMFGEILFQIDDRRKTADRLLGKNGRGAK
jgi:hypothetical protein